MTRLEYSKEVMKNFLHPKNYGEIKNPDAVGYSKNPICHDAMTIYIKVKDNKIRKIKYTTYGCAAAIASASMTTELAKGKTMKEAGNIKVMDIIGKLDGLPVVKHHCTQLAKETLLDAIADFNSGGMQARNIVKPQSKDKCDF